MPALTTLTLTDRSATDHAFTPRAEEPNGVMRFSKPDASGVPNGASHLRISLRESPSNIRVRLKLEVPTVVTETVNGVANPKVVRSAMADLTFTFAKTSTTAERELVVGLMADALGASQSEIDSVLTDLESFF
jgi:hypothetical protein